MIKRRRLSDLYVRGKDLTIGDGHGDSVSVWLQKLNGIDRESCVRRAHAQRARFMSESDNPDSDVFQALYAQVRSMQDREGLVGLVVAEDVGRFRQRTEAELARDEDGWGKDNYIQGLVDLWTGDDTNAGLAATAVQDPDDPEAVRVKAELDRFEAEVVQRTEEEHQRLLADWADAPDETVWHKATERFLETRAIEAFNREFERQQVFYSVREPDDHTKRYFGTLTELDDLDDKVRQQLFDTFNSLMVDPTEGKGLRASQPSSNSSDPSPAEEASTDSGLRVVNA